jgi:hypothetical protein
MIGVLLCGGMATRLGMGPKAAVEIAPGQTLLDYRLKQVLDTGHCSRVFCFVSPYTASVVGDIIRRFPKVKLLHQALPGGHGEVLEALRGARVNETAWIANVDNLGAVPRSRDDVNSLEVVPALASDAGGFLHPGGLRRDVRSGWVSTNTWTLTPAALRVELLTGDGGEKRLDDLVALLRGRLWVRFMPRDRLRPIKTVADLATVQNELQRNAA